MGLGIFGNPPQVFAPAQRYPVGGPGGSRRDGGRVREEGGGEPGQREPQGAPALSHPGVCGQHGGGGGLHPVLHQR